MKPITMMLLLFLAFAAGVSAQTKNPEELDQIKAEYQAQVKSTLDPINRKYLQQLDALKKQLGGKGDLDSALKVQKHIEEFSAKANTAPPGSKLHVPRNETVKQVNAPNPTLNAISEDDAMVFKDVGLPKTPNADSVQLINLEPEIARVGWASMVNGKDIKGDNDPNVGCRPTINNQMVKEDFIYTPSSSHIRYSVPSGVRYFSATMGTRNGKPDTVVFKILVDRKVIFESKMRDWEKNVLDVAVELPPSPKKIDLIIEQPGGGNANPTFWAFPKFLKSKPDKLNAPPNIGANPPPVKHKAMESDGRSVPLINLKPEMAKVGWANLIIGKDIKKDKDPNANCRPFIDNDFVTEDFLYAPCTSQLQYDIPDGMKFFTATLGSKDCGSMFKVLADGKELFSSYSKEWENTFLDIVVELPANSKKLGLLIDNTAGGNAKGTLWIFPRFLTGDRNGILTIK